MKKSYTLLLVLSFYLLPGIALAQPVIEIGGLAAISGDKAFPIIGGGGFEMGIYTPPLNIIKTKSTKRNYMPSKLCLRAGGNFFFSTMGSKSFDHIPLLAPEEGDAKVYFNNSVYAGNLSARISSSMFKGAVIPYVQGDVGYRTFYSELQIDPHDAKAENTYRKLEEIGGLNLSATGGILIKLGASAYLNTGVTYSHSDGDGKFVDLRSLNRVGDNIEYTRKSGSKDFYMFRLGLSIYIGSDSGNNSGGSSGGSRHSCNSNWLDGLFSGGGRGNSNIGLIIH